MNIEAETPKPETLNMKITAHEVPWDALPKHARTTMDNPDQTFRVIDGNELRRLILTGNDPKAALQAANVSTFEIRYTSGGTCYVVGRLWWTTDTETRIFLGTAGGYGYDKRASACQGMPFAPGLVLTDHCGLDGKGYPPILDAHGYPMREITLERLPAGYFTF